MNRSYRWRAATGMQLLASLPGGFPSGAEVHRTSADGTWLVAQLSSPSYRAMRWSAATGAQDLGALPASVPMSFVRDVSADGSVVIGQSHIDPGNDVPFRWTQAGGMVQIPLPPGHVEGSAEAISADGLVVVGYTRPPSLGYEPLRWTAAGGPQALGTLSAGANTFATDTSGDGSVVVGYDHGSPSRAFVWDGEQGMRPLGEWVATAFGFDLGGYELGYAMAVSSDGRTIVGNARHPDLQTSTTEGYRLVLPPKCDDGLDNDGDGLVDHPADPQCASATDDFEGS